MNIPDKPLENIITQQNRKSDRLLKFTAEREPKRAPQKFNDYLRFSNARRKNVKLNIIRWHIAQ